MGRRHWVQLLCSQEILPNTGAQREVLLIRFSGERGRFTLCFFPTHLYIFCIYAATQHRVFIHGFVFQHCDISVTSPPSLIWLAFFSYVHIIECIVSFMTWCHLYVCLYWMNSKCHTTYWLYISRQVKQNIGGSALIYTFFGPLIDYR